MNSIDLNSYYRLYAFSDYSSMKVALPYMRKVVLARSLVDVEETDIRKYLDRMPNRGFINYLQPLHNPNKRTTASQSFISALQLLYKSNGYSARYVVVERVY
ncbi:hypothetical protein [Pontibacter sp. H249]|uniref:hypothetical protein n=1 Tax=Pontibacter sp. H249 TaxID=3133420 RepID=UPI0030C221DC